MDGEVSVKVSVELDDKEFKQQLKDLTKELTIGVNLELSSKQFENDFRSITSNLESIKIDVDCEYLQKQIQNCLDSGSYKIKIDGDIDLGSSGASSSKKPTPGGNSGGDSVVADTIQDSSKKIVDEIKLFAGSFGDFAASQVRGNIFKSLLSPFTSIFRGAFEGLGREFTRNSGRGLADSFEGNTGNIFANIATVAGKKLADIFNQKTGQSFPKQLTGTTVDNSKGFGFDNDSLKSANNVIKEVIKDLKAVQSILRYIPKVGSFLPKIIDTLGQVSGIVDTFVDLNNNGQAVSDTFVRLAKIIDIIINSSGTNQATQQKQQQTIKETKPNNQQKQPSSQGLQRTQFLQGDLTKIQAKSIKRQVDQYIQALEEQFSEIQSSDIGNKSQLLSELLVKAAKAASNLKQDLEVLKSQPRFKGKSQQLGAVGGQLTKKINQLSPQATRQQLEDLSNNSQPSPDAIASTRSSLERQFQGMGFQRSNIDLKAAQVNFEKIAREAAKLAKIRDFKLPEISFEKLAKGVKGFYDEAENIVRLPDEMQKELASGNISADLVETIVHELRHAMQLASGKLGLPELTQGKTGVKLQGSKDTTVLKEAQASTTAFAQRNKTTDKRTLDTVNALEVDAAEFARKNSASIKASFDKSLGKGNIKDTLVKTALTQVVGILGTAIKTGIENKLKTVQDVIIKRAGNINVGQLDQERKKVFGLFRTNTNDPGIQADNSKNINNIIPDDILQQLFDKAGLNDLINNNAEAVTGAGVVAGSAGLMFAPETTLKAAFAPLLTILSPVTIAFNGLYRVLSPVIGVMIDTLKELTPILNRFDSIATQQNSTGGGKGLFDFATESANQLGVPLNVAVDGFSKLAAAASQTSLQGEPIKELFLGISKATTSLGLSTQDAELIFLAFQQILSKGKLSAEEVRQQIGERFPQAINLFAKALGVPVTEFNKLLESGSLLSQDVLPLVAKELNNTFSGSAEKASSSFVGSFNRLSNALTQIRYSLAKELEPAFASFFNGLATIAQKSSGVIIQVFKTLGSLVFSIGFSLQAGLGIVETQIGLFSKLATVLLPLTKLMSSIFAPFVVGTLVDVTDDVTQALTGVDVMNPLEATIKSVFNIVLIAISTTETLIGKVKEIFSGIGDGIKSLVQTIQPLLQVINAIGGALAGLGNLGKGFIALLGQVFAITVFTRQTLAFFGLNAAFFVKVGGVFTNFGKAILAGAKNGKIFQEVINSVTFGLKAMEIATYAAVAVLILFFAKADLFPASRKELDATIKGFNELTKSIQQTNNAADKTKLPTGGDVASKGFKLLPIVGEAIGFDPKTDDVIKGIEKFFGSNLEVQTDITAKLDTEGLKAFNDLLKTGKLNVQDFAIAQQKASGDRNLFTVLRGENIPQLRKDFKSFADQAGLTSDEFEKLGLVIRQVGATPLDITSLGELQLQQFEVAVGQLEGSLSGLADASQLLTDNFTNTEIGKGLIPAKEIDKKILELQSQRKIIAQQLADPLVAPEQQQDLKNKAGAIDQQVIDLLSQREQVIKPLKQFIEDFKARVSLFENLKKSIIDNPDLSENEKKLRIEKLQPIENEIKTFQKRIADLGIEVNLTPLGENFSQATSEIQKAIAAIDTFNKQLELTTTRKKGDSLGDLVSGKITQQQFDDQQAIAESDNALARYQELVKQVDIIKKNLETLLAIPAPSQEQRDDIEKLKQEALNADSELAKARIDLAQSVLAKRKQIEESITNTIETEAKKRQQALETKFIELENKVLQQQLGVGLTGKLTVKLTGVESQELQDQLNINKLKEDAIGLVNDANKQISEAISKSSEKTQITIFPDGSQKTETIPPLITEKQAKKLIDEGKNKLAKANNQLLEAEVKQRELISRKTLRLADEQVKQAEANVSRRVNAAKNAIATEQALASDQTKASKQAGQDLSVIEYNRVAELARLKKAELQQTTQFYQDGILDRAQFTEKNRQLSDELQQLEGDQAQALINYRQQELDNFRSDIETRGALASKQSELTVDGTNAQIDSLDRLDKKLEKSAQIIDAFARVAKATQDIKLSSLNQQLSNVQQGLEIKGISQSSIKSIEEADKALEDIRNKRKEGNLKSGEATSLVAEEKAILEQRKRLQDRLSFLGFTNTSPDNLLKQQETLEKQIAQAKIDALLSEQQIQQQLLLIENKRNTLAADRAVKEAEIAKLQAQQQILTAQGELAIATASGDTNAQKIALINLDIANRQSDLANTRLQDAKDNIKIQETLNGLSSKALGLEQQGARQGLQGEIQSNLAFGSDFLRSSQQQLNNGVNLLSQQNTPKNLIVPTTLQLQDPSVFQSAFAQLNGLGNKQNSLNFDKANANQITALQQLGLSTSEILGTATMATVAKNTDSMVTNLNQVLAALTNKPTVETVNNTIYNTFDDSSKQALLEEVRRTQSQTTLNTLNSVINNVSK